MDNPLNIKKITLPEVVERFKAYHKTHLTWGSLHIVLGDSNLDNDSVDFCMSYARDNGDVEGMELAKILRQLSYTQRNKLAQLPVEFAGAMYG